MPKGATPPGSRSESRLDTYTTRFAEGIISALEEKQAPWQRPWKAGELTGPRNAVTGRRYNGGNFVWLMFTAMQRGYSDPRWAGFHQILKAGGHVRKGEKGAQILIWREGRGRETSEETDETERERPRLYAACHYVFNVGQTDGLELEAPSPTTASWEPAAAVQRVARDAAVTIEHVAGDRAYYNITADTVVMPTQGQFGKQWAYEYTLLHELAHSTMHPTRLDREEARLSAGRGGESYAIEELRAEISALMLGEQLEIGHEPRHGTSYLANWIQALRNDPAYIRRAATDAQRISDWLTRNIRAGRVAQIEEKAA